MASLTNDAKEAWHPDNIGLDSHKKQQKLKLSGCEALCPGDTLTSRVLGST